MISLINEYRKNNDLQTLIVENTLNNTASEYAEVLLNSGSLSHIDRNGNRVLDRYRLEGGTAVQAGEILGSSSELSDIFEAWKISIPHNMMMMDSKWLRIGSAVLERDGVYVAVVLFSGSSLSSYRFVPEEKSVKVILKSIYNNKEIFFSQHIYNISDSYGKLNLQESFISIPIDRLPLLLSLYIESGGINKMSDFLYIPEIIKLKTH